MLCVKQGSCEDQLKVWPNSKSNPSLQLQRRTLLPLGHLSWYNNITVVLQCFVASTAYIVMFLSAVSQIAIYPDDANFTGIIPDDTFPVEGNQLFSPFRSRTPYILPLGHNGDLPFSNVSERTQLMGKIRFFHIFFPDSRMQTTESIVFMVWEIMAFHTKNMDRIQENAWPQMTPKIRICFPRIRI